MRLITILLPLQWLRSKVPRGNVLTCLINLSNYYSVWNRVCTFATCYDIDLIIYHVQDHSHQLKWFLPGHNPLYMQLEDCPACKLSSTWSHAFTQFLIYPIKQWHQNTKCIVLSKFYKLMYYSGPLLSSCSAACACIRNRKSIPDGSSSAVTPFGGNRHLQVYSSLAYYQVNKSWNLKQLTHSTTLATCLYCSYRQGRSSMSQGQHRIAGSWILHLACWRLAPMRVYIGPSP